MSTAKDGAHAHGAARWEEAAEPVRGGGRVRIVRFPRSGEWAVLPLPAAPVPGPQLQETLRALPFPLLDGPPVAFSPAPAGDVPGGLAVLYSLGGRAVVHCSRRHIAGAAPRVLSELASLAASARPAPGGQPARVALLPHRDLLREGRHPGWSEPGEGGTVIGVCDRLVTPRLADAAGRLLAAHLRLLGDAGF